MTTLLYIEDSKIGNYQVKKSFLVATTSWIIALMIITKSSISLCQEVFFPFHSGECTKLIRAFYEKGFNAKTCKAMEDWSKELPTVQNGSCGSVLNAAQVKGGSHPLEMILKQFVKRLKELNCGNGGGSESATPNGGINQANNIVPTDFGNITQSLLEKIQRDEVYRQSLITQKHETNKYTNSIESTATDELTGSTITFKNNSQMKVIIIDTTGSQIKYKRVELPDGPTFIINKKDILKINSPIK